LAGSAGDWLVLEELFDRGDPAFVDGLRLMTDAEALGGFAARWNADKRSSARRLLLDYLDRPLNAYRHEALIKRLFKLAEAAGDDEVMAHFLVAFDRSIRRIRRKRRHQVRRKAATKREADQIVADWLRSGFDSAHAWGGPVIGYTVWGVWSEEVLTTPRHTAMPRGAIKQLRGSIFGIPGTELEVPDWVVRLGLVVTAYKKSSMPTDAIYRRLEKFRLFSTATREYLRRRAWRYFRRLGRDQPGRYVSAIKQALVLYNDSDVPDGVALLDNWGLIHALFHQSPVLVSKPNGWIPAEGHSLAELEPAPIYARLWKAEPRAIFDLLGHARSHTVRQWAIAKARREPSIAASISLDELLELLHHDDPDVVMLGADFLRMSPQLAAIEPDRWLSLAETAGPSSIEVLAELIRQHLPADRVTLEQAARLARLRPIPLARLGLDWLKAKAPGPDDVATLFGLLEALSDPVRPELLRWTRQTLAALPGYRREWPLEFLDSHRSDVRIEGLEWLRDDPRVHDDVTIWQQLMESPHDDVRFRLVADLESRHARGRIDDRPLDPELLRLLWASVLLNIHRGGRSKPKALQQIVMRLETRPDELPHLLPLLSVALRSVRGPEWRAALAAVVGMVERRPETAPLVRSAFPELQGV
jgi:hypothetical protein